MILRCVDNLWKESVSTSIELSENSATAITVGLQRILRLSDNLWKEIKAILKSHDLYLMIKSVGKYDKHDVSGRSFSRDNLWKER